MSETEDTCCYIIGERFAERVAQALHKVDEQLERRFRDEVMCENEEDEEEEEGGD